MNAAQTIHAPVVSAESAAPINKWILYSLFTTLTNVNFDDSRLLVEVAEGIAARQRARLLFDAACRAKHLNADAEAKKLGLSNNFYATAALPSTTTSDAVGVLTQWSRTSRCAVDVRRAEAVAANTPSNNVDIIGLQELSVYAIKGVAAYAVHTDMLNGLDNDSSASVSRELVSILSTISSDSSTVDSLLGAVMACGALNLKVMELLDAANRQYGIPTPFKVNCKPVKGKCILVSGHDLKDLEEILKAADKNGVNVYTHGEMLPAHSYPKLRAFKSLVGNYGGPWQLQKYEFGAFPGAIVMTSNCLVEPLKSYKGRIFTRGPTGFDGITHLPTQDYSAVIEAAKQAPGFTDDAEENKLASREDVWVGFGRETIMSVADKVIQGVKDGKIGRFYYIGGCDGSETERSYFSDLAASLPNDTVILTAGCGKFRVNRLPVAKQTIELSGGFKLPRVLDMGQCNDSYAGIKVAEALCGAFNLKHPNELPLSFAVSWFEQKAVAILTTLLHLGIKNVHIGPNLPAFVTPNMLNIIVSKFNLQGTDSKNVAGDVKKMQAGQ